MDAYIKLAEKNRQELIGANQEKNTTVTNATLNTNYCVKLANSVDYKKFKMNQLGTKDYVHLADMLFLKEYRVTFSSHPFSKVLSPFAKWNLKEGETTKSISWYDNYNKTKHNRAFYFKNATLESCLNAIAANIIMFCVRLQSLRIIQITR